MPKKPDPNCCLCGLPYERIGNNPAPLTEKGRCCDACNQIVIAARINPSRMEREIIRVAEALERKLAAPMGEVALAAICASRGPDLLAARNEMIREHWPDLTKH